MGVRLGIRSRRRSGASECPFCRDGLQGVPSAEVARCSGCAVVLHAECAGEIARRCPIPGCAGELATPEPPRPAPERRPGPRGRPDAPRPYLWCAIGAALGGLGAGWLAGLMGDDLMTGVGAFFGALAGAAAGVFAASLPRDDRPDILARLPLGVARLLVLTATLLAVGLGAAAGGWLGWTFPARPGKHGTALLGGIAAGLVSPLATPFLAAFGAGLVGAAWRTVRRAAASLGAGARGADADEDALAASLRRKSD